MYLISVQKQAQLPTCGLTNDQHEAAIDSAITRILVLSGEGRTPNSVSAVRLENVCVPEKTSAGVRF